LRKILGAFPEAAKPYNALELVYKSLEAADHAEVKRHALIIEGRALMPARSIAMTKGEAAAVPFPSFKSRPSEFDGTRRPIINVPRT